MSKLYYKDPIIAAYMSQYFKVSFIDAKSNALFCGYNDNGCSWYYMEKGNVAPFQYKSVPYTLKKFYIAHNSLDIFDYQKYDIGINYIDEHRHITMRGWQAAIYWGRWLYRGAVNKQDNEKIIFRGGQVFFSPNVEV